jgi:hypothetical protein
LVRLQRVVFCAPRRSARAKGSAVPTDGPELPALAPGELVVCARYVKPQTQMIPRTLKPRSLLRGLPTVVHAVGVLPSLQHAARCTWALAAYSPGHRTDRNVRGLGVGQCRCVVQRCSAVD